MKHKPTKKSDYVKVEGDKIKIILETNNFRKLVTVHNQQIRDLGTRMIN